MSNSIGIALLGLGLFFNLVGCIGVIRFPDIYNRLQASTKCITMGTCSFLLGTMLLAGGGAIAVKCGLCILLIFITSPTAAHALARSSHKFGIKLWEKSVVNKYDEDHPAPERKEP